MPRRFDFVSPGVQLTEIDQSTVPATLEGDGPLIIGRGLVRLKVILHPRLCVIGCYAKI